MTIPAFYPSKYGMAALLLPLAALVAPMAAEARPDTPNVSRIIQTRDLDLATQTGRRALDQRIRHAASKVCGVDESAIRRVDNPCYVTAMREANVQRDELIARRADGEDSQLAESSNRAPRSMRDGQSN